MWAKMMSLSGRCSAENWRLNSPLRVHWPKNAGLLRRGFQDFILPQGYGTEVAEGKETREFNGKMHVLEEAYRADFAFVKAWKGDEAGNLIFRGTARNFNPCMCGAAKITVAEVEQLVPVGGLDPNSIHIPGIFINRIFQGETFEKRIEQRTTRKKAI